MSGRGRAQQITDQICVAVCLRIEGGGAQRDYVILTVIRVEGGVIRGDALARQHAAVLS